MIFAADSRGKGSQRQVEIQPVLPYRRGGERSLGFIDSIRNRFDSFRQDKELAGIEILSVDAETVIAAVCDVCRVSKQELLTSRRGVANLPRDLAVYMLRSHSQQTLLEIGNCFGISNYSTVSTILERAKKHWLEIRKFVKYTRGLV